jgi:hypothetical protein
LDDKKVPALQAADLMAHTAKYRLLEWLDDPEKKMFTADAVLHARLKRLNVHKIQVWDRDYMMTVLDHEIKRRRLGIHDQAKY